MEPETSMELQSTSDWLDRKNAARIVHEFLKNTLKEPDEADWSQAKSLRDIYDCHICVQHVAQVYVKGIMGSETDTFGMSKSLTLKEAHEIIEKMFYKNLRTPPQKKISVQTVEKLTYREAMLQKHSLPKLRLIDVRTRNEYEQGHLTDAISIPLQAIMKNPYQVSEDPNKPLLFYCENGYQSEIAANCVLEAGYKNVGYFGKE